MSFFKQQNNKDRQKGFSLVEALISIAILMISVALPMSMAWSGLSAAYLAEDQIIAFYLTQDAIEYIRNKRDYNKLANTADMLQGIFGNCLVDPTDGNSPTQGIDDPGTSQERGCIVDTFDSPSDDSSLVAFSGQKLCYENDQYYYTPTCENFSKFSRQVRVGYVSTDPSPTEAIVEVIVRWPNDIDVEQEYRLRTHLTEW